MPSLTMPIQIWISMSRDEKDAAYLSAGFNPDFPVVDNGTDATTVRFFQSGRPAVGSTPAAAAPSVTAGPQAGDDLRDFQTVSVEVGPVAPGTTTDEFGVPVAGTALAIAGRALKIILGGGGGRIVAATWNSLPSIARSALTQIGIGVGALIAFNGDIPFITLPGQGDTSVAPFIGPVMPLANGVDIQIGAHLPSSLGAHVVGSWNTNPKNPAEGVTFYRLSNGWLAVQKKNGSWKTWKPKRPIVIYADGASNLKTMLRADKALTKQAKKLATMLNKRAPRKKSSPAALKGPIIIESGPGNVVTRA